MTEIGRIVERGQGSFLWEIPGFSGLPEERGIPFSSPYIDLAKRRWNLSVFPRWGDAHILLHLRRWDSRPAKTFHCTVGVRRADGAEETVGEQTVKLGDGCVRCVLYEFRKRHYWNSEILSSGTLTVTLRIREVAASSQNKTSWETQTEVLENTTDREPETKGMMLLARQMREVLSQSDDYDVRFRVGDREFPAHRNILKARCPVFSMMLTHDTQENQSGIICIEDCDADAFGVFLTYVYSGEAENLTPQIALDLYYMAEKYDFPWLKDHCVNFLDESLSKTTVGDVFLLSAKHDESELMEAATNFFIEYIGEIIVTVEWQNFMMQNPVEANELYIKYVFKQ